MSCHIRRFFLFSYSRQNGLTSYPTRSFSTSLATLNRNVSPQEKAQEKAIKSAKLDYQEDVKQRGSSSKRADAVQAAMEGQDRNDYSAAARQGLGSKNIDGPEVDTPATRTDSKGVSDSAPRPIIGFEDYTGGSKPKRSDADFKKAPKQK